MCDGRKLLKEGFAAIQSLRNWRMSLNVAEEEQ